MVVPQVDIPVIDGRTAYRNTGQAAICPRVAAKKMPVFNVGGIWPFSATQNHGWIPEEVVPGAGLSDH